MSRRDPVGDFLDVLGIVLPFVVMAIVIVLIATGVIDTSSS
jgi:hypothetical protein